MSPYLVGLNSNWSPLFTIYNKSHVFLSTLILTFQWNENLNSDTKLGLYKGRGISSDLNLFISHGQHHNQ